MLYLISYNGYDIYDNTTPECWTLYPITVKYGKQFVKSYRNITEAKQDIDREPEWMIAIKDKEPTP